jgi:hypothetical protein
MWLFVLASLQEFKGCYTEEKTGGINAYEVSL